MDIRDQDKALRTEDKLLNLIQSSFPNFHPAIILSEAAKDTKVDMSIRIQAAKALMPYVAPQLKAIEISGNLKHDFGMLKVSMIGEDDYLPDFESEDTDKDDDNEDEGILTQLTLPM